MYNQLNDIELWERIKLDDNLAYEALFNKYWEDIFKTAYHYLKDRDLCQEITHDIFLNIWNKRATLDINYFKQYLKTAARYHVYKQHKLRVVNLNYVDEIESLEHNTVYNAGEEKIKLSELEGSINFFVNQLPNRCKEVFLLSRSENLSNSEIAAKLGISKRSVENQITAALKYLRQHIKATGIIILLFTNVFCD